MLSGPVALCGLICCSSSHTPSCVTSNLRMSGCGLGPRFGRSVMFSVVKTDENCPLRTRALLMLSLCSFPSLSSAATPVSSQRLLLMYCQKFCRLLAMLPQIMSCIQYILLVRSATVKLHWFFKSFVSAPVTCVTGRLPFYRPLTSF